MSTDDLVRRARAAARGLKPTLSGTSALVTELADEVDRLRGERDRWKARSVTAGADLDAARAALERVRAIVEDGDRLDGLWIYAPDLDRALEGEAP